MSKIWINQGKQFISNFLTISKATIEDAQRQSKQREELLSREGLKISKIRTDLNNKIILFNEFKEHQNQILKERQDKLHKNYKIHFDELSLLKNQYVDQSTKFSEDYKIKQKDYNIRVEEHKKQKDFQQAKLNEYNAQIVKFNEKRSHILELQQKCNADATNVQLRIDLQEALGQQKALQTELEQHKAKIEEEKKSYASKTQMLDIERIQLQNLLDEVNKINQFLQQRTDYYTQKIEKLNKQYETDNIEKIEKLKNKLKDRLNKKNAKVYYLKQLYNDEEYLIQQLEAEHKVQAKHTEILIDEYNKLTKLLEEGKNLEEEEFKKFIIDHMK
ncbi:hypothetical protein pb186bvf_015126 [Paramecium bursaria]